MITPEKAAEELVGMFGFISESMWSAGWRGGIEYDFWAYSIGERDPSPHMDDFNWYKMLKLAHLCKGWWVFSTKHGRTLLPLVSWFRVYEVYKEKGSKIAQDSTEEEAEALLSGPQTDDHSMPYVQARLRYQGQG